MSGPPLTTTPLQAEAGPKVSLLSLEGVTVRFGRKEALADLDLVVHEGDLLAVIGPDGAGKSTLLQLLAGLRAPTAGRVTRTVPKEQLGFSGSAFDLYGDLTVSENLRFFASVRGMTKKAFYAACERILPLVGLMEAADRLGAALSGGMKKKLGLAAALIHAPRLLVLDEPTLGVDPVSRRELWGIIAEVHAAGTTVVFSTTYLDEAERARRVMYLSEGRATELTPESMARMAAGWRVWLLRVGEALPEARAALARASLGPRVYWREESVAFLVQERAEAERLAAQVAAGPLEPGSLTLDDLFVLMRLKREEDGPPPPGEEKRA